MSSSLAALTSGGGGIAMTADSSGNLNLLSGTTTVLALTATGIAVTGTLTSSGVLSATSPTFVTPVIDSATVATVSGTAPLYMCRAWVNFNGTGTVAIRASGNVSSITDNAAGDYTVNFTTAMPDANYSWVASVAPNYGADWLFSNINVTTASATESAPTTTSCRMQLYGRTTGVADSKYVNVTVFR